MRLLSSILVASLLIVPTAHAASSHQENMNKLLKKFGPVFNFAGNPANLIKKAKVACICNDAGMEDEAGFIVYNNEFGFEVLCIVPSGFDANGASTTSSSCSSYQVLSK